MDADTAAVGILVIRSGEDIAMMQVISCLLCFAIALIFGASLVSSWLDDRFWNTRLQLEGLGIIPARLAIGLTAGAAVAELIVLSLYIMPAHGWWRAAFTGCFLLMMTAYLVVKRMQGRHSSCSCIGQIGFLNRYPIARNFGLIAIVAAEALLPVQAISLTAVIGSAIVLASVLTVYACRFVLRRIRRDRLATGRGRELAGSGFADAAYLRVDYSSGGFQTVNELLAYAPLPAMIIKLHAPLWYVEGKKKAWSRHFVLAASDTAADQEPAGPLLVWTTKRGAVRMTTEIESMLKLLAKKGEQSPDVHIKSSIAAS